ncbi:MAG: DUF2249 domain-containing protein [Uliginosibacterium sp.]|nr:DUF2249 domain-containing protein [Uliginosibacterium sp.]
MREPFDRILAATDESCPSARALEVLIHREPLPLWEWLAEHGFGHRTVQESSEQFRIFIHHLPS